MQDAKTNLLLRDDTIFGVCQGLGDDLGFDPFWLRLALASGMLWNPTVMVTAYGALAVVVLLSRLGFPDRRTAAPARDQASPAGRRPSAPETQEKASRQPMPVAA
jgi:phage shock protein PspC (stress-responsive transcriptional regulator)